MTYSSTGSENPLAAIKPHVNVLRRHVPMLILSSLLVAVVGIVVIAYLPDVYQATTTILVDPQKIPERYVASTVTSDPNEHLNTLTQQVLSTSRLQEIIDRNSLYPGLRRKNSREELLEYMRKKIKIELKKGSDQGLSSFTITYEDGDRRSVAVIANQLAGSFIDWNLRVRQQQARDTTQFLSNELNQAKKSLVQQEGRLEAFKMRHVGATPDQLDGNLQTISRLQMQAQSNADAISRLDEERIMLTQSRPSVVNDPASLTERERLWQEKHRLENELWRLRRQFTDTYPDVAIAKDQLQSVNARIAALPLASADDSEHYDSATQGRLNMIARELERHKQQQAALQQQIGSYQEMVDTVPVLESQLTELSRNYETSRQNYQSLLDKTLSAGMSQDLEHKQQSERFVILDPARTPEKPIRPKRFPLMAGAVLAAVLFSMGSVIGVNLLLGRIDSEAQLRSLLPAKVAILGTIPPITNIEDRRRQRVVLSQTLVASVVTCIAVILFLLRMRTQ
jgi:succinoglycan biosynthesis transport protein ExoP